MAHHFIFILSRQKIYPEILCPVSHNSTDKAYMFLTLKTFNFQKFKNPLKNKHALLFNPIKFCSVRLHTWSLWDFC